MPQAVLRVASCTAVPRDAIAVAATYVLGFRATLGAVRLDPSWAPAPDLVEAATSERDAMLDGTPDEAAAAMWAAPFESRSQLVGRLATRAAVHPDAHLAKYVLACLDAAAVDPDAKVLYLAAAAFLAGWWREQPATDDPISAP
jgi:hypothetical protein